MYLGLQICVTNIGNLKTFNSLPCYTVRSNLGKAESSDRMHLLMNELGGIS